MIRVGVDASGLPEEVTIERLDYVLDFIQSHPCAPPGVSVSRKAGIADCIVQYGISNVPGHFKMPFANVCFAKDAKDLTIPDCYYFKYNERLLGGFKPSDNKYYDFEVDIFETIFFLISRMEEWFPERDALDEHKRLHSDKHFLIKAGLNETPVVDILVYHFFETLGLEPVKTLSSYSLTHDVDVIRKFPSWLKIIKSYANIIFYRPKKLRTLYRQSTTLLSLWQKKTKDPFDTFHWLLNPSSEKITSKLIYFLSGGKTKYENFFSIRSKEASDIITIAVESGYTIGIHPSYNSGNSLQMTSQELARLEDTVGHKIFDSRQHFLRFFFPDTPHILDNLNLKSDSSLGYSNKIGFRCGTGFPYHLYDFSKESPFKFVEIPMIVMDMALVHLHKGDVYAIKKHVSEFINQNQHFTHINFNFHNSTFDPVFLDAAAFKELYQNLFTGQNQ